MIFLFANLYVHHLIFFSYVMHMHIKLMNEFRNWLISNKQSLMTLQITRFAIDTLLTFSKIPDVSPICVKLTDIFRFSRVLVTQQLTS